MSSMSIQEAINFPAWIGPPGSATVRKACGGLVRPGQVPLLWGKFGGTVCDGRAVQTNYVGMPPPPPLPSFLVNVPSRCIPDHSRSGASRSGPVGSI